MRLDDFITHTTKQLTDSGIITARLDCLILLEDELAIDRASLLAHPEMILSNEVIERLQAKVVRRCTHEPLAYICGTAAFYGRDFIVTPNVLVPRPETESVIDLLKTLDLSKLPKTLGIADIGTGSGCIGITAALELPAARVDLIDISPDALAVAQDNVAKHALTKRVECYIADLLEDSTRPYDIILTNLPYVPDGFPINEAAQKEPALALFSGVDGMEHYKRFWQQLAARPQQPTAYVLTESFPNQHHFNATLARQAGFTLINMSDFIQVFEYGTAS